METRLSELPIVTVVTSLCAGLSQCWSGYITDKLRSGEGLVLADELILLHHLLAALLKAAFYSVGATGAHFVYTEMVGGSNPSRSTIYNIIYCPVWTPCGATRIEWGNISGPLKGAERDVKQHSRIYWGRIPLRTRGAL